MIIEERGKQSVSIKIDSAFMHERNLWMFCTNGHQSTGVNITVEQYDMLKKMLCDPRVVKFYAELRREGMGLYDGKRE